MPSWSAVSNGSWILPWAILPEVDYLLASHLGPRAQDAFLADLGGGEWAIEWGQEADLVRAHELTTKYRSLRVGLVDAVVIAVAERLRASAIATLDLRHFGTVAIRGHPPFIPRDL
jgi:uncharacterized protein